jgi:hypothetical protein
MTNTNGTATNGNMKQPVVCVLYVMSAVTLLHLFADSC